MTKREAEAEATKAWLKVGESWGVETGFAVTLPGDVMAWEEKWQRFLYM